MGRIAIRAEDVAKRLGTTEALRGVSTTFAPARLHGLIGPDGAGKTTFLRVATGLLHPDRGAVHVEEDGRATHLDAVRERIAYMPQQQSLYPDLSVGEHLEFFRDVYGIPAGVYHERRAKLLAMTRMTPFQERPAAKLSGGMYKKLGLMCALMQSPDALLLDEPTNGVDPISRREFWELLYGLIRQGILVVVATAYMDEAERCNRVHVFHAGRVIADGEPRRLLAEAGAASFEEYFIRREGEAA